MAEKPAMAGMMKKRFCEGDDTQCAHGKICEALGTANMPRDLYPDQLDRLPALRVS
jgi:hypothetical protein